MEKRLTSIDIIKGLLIILVILGHIIPGKLDQVLARYIIYAFHMPLFIGLSGYLVKTEYLSKLSVKEFLSKFLRRVILPWGIAVIIYFLIVKYDSFLDGSTEEKLKLIFYAISKPWYHLWFIPAYVLYISLIKLQLNMKIPILLILIFSLITSLFFKLENLTIENSLIKELFHIITYTFRLENFFYFSLGLTLRNTSFNLKSFPYFPILLLLITSFAWKFLLFKSGNIILDNIIYYTLNISFVFLMLKIISRERTPYKCSILQFIGQNSLGFYLWHMIFVILISTFTKNQEIIPLIVFNITGFFILYWAIKGILENPTTKKYLLGDNS